uniref:F-box/FBD/LRR-repeat protein At5g56420-like isoform X1 n=1 Tax=Fragaria vesca subsp. vesca TaxID=101020 RepID=UPI0005C811B3|nr:PREDICTED: F-box/FBD/LRR-repeat protein At5g56420-like isoform X1 [Fragaria vesca subsp. vesca]
MSEVEAKRVNKDRISALPDAILYHILSFLTTEDVVTTIFLSRRWKKIWASVPSLDFCDHENPETIPFSRFIDNVLFFRDSTDIHKFRLHSISVGDFDRVCGWIGAAIRRNVAELDLSVEYSGLDDQPQIFELPQSVFTSKTLRVLHLWSNFIINAPASGCFPNLKSLYVHIDRPINKSMEKFLSCCPVLEDLTIYGSHGHYGDEVVLNITVSAPELKTLEIHWTTYNDYERCNFHVVAPKLETFHLRQYPSTDCYLENAKSLVRVTISLQDHFEREDRLFVIRGTALLAVISNVRYLSLSAHCLKGCCLPVFDKLSRLELALYSCYYWELLKELFRRSPKLEYLVLELKDFKCPGASSNHQWSPPDTVPICLLTHLKTVSIRGIKGKLDEMDAAKYLLTNGEVLKNLTLYSKDLSHTKEEIYKELSMCRWGSKTCQVEFYGDQKDERFSLGMQVWRILRSMMDSTTVRACMLDVTTHQDYLYREIRGES